VRAAYALLIRVGTPLLALLHRQVRTLVVPGLLAAALLLSHVATARGADSPALRLRVAWGGGAEQTWHGTIAVRPGRVTEKQALGIETDEPGSMWIEDGRLEIRQRSPRQYDGVDVAIDSSIDATLIVSLSTKAQQSPPRTVEIPLQKLVKDQFSTALDEQDNRLLVRRAPGDQLRVAVRNSSLVLAPGENLHLDVHPHLLGGPMEGGLRFEYHVRKARRDEIVWSHERVTDSAEAAMAPWLLEVPAPSDEGVYDLTVTATVTTARSQFAPGNPFRNRQQVVAERKVQFVVLEATDPRQQNQNGSAVPDTVIDEINPAKPWWKRVTEIPKLPGLGNGPLQHGQVETWEHPQLGTMVRLGPNAAESDANWTAYPLSVDYPGQPHILEVQYATNIPQAMGISLMEPNAAGSVLPLGLDSGVFVPDEAADLQAEIGAHRMVVWPRTREPVVLITNQRDDAPAAHGKIRLLGPKATGVARLKLADAPATRLPRAMPSQALDEGRLLAAFMNRPLIPENFSATEAFDPWSQRSMDDWVTFYDAAVRLIDYLQYAGYNGFAVSVAAGGSTIYPTTRLEPTPRYDTGIFFATGQDPVRKDVLELLFRMCDRSGIRLIPTIEFATPLPELEAIIRQGGPDSVGLEAVGADGVRWTQKYRRHDGPSAYYNPLHPRVQQAMLGVVHELVDRYRGHPSFAGLAIGTSGFSYALLPGPAWPSDPRTLQQFSQEANVQLPRGETSRVHNGPLAQQWLDWRAYRLRQFHGRLAEQVQRHRPDSKLYLALSPLLESPDIRQMLRPALPPRFKPRDALLGIGVKPELYGRSPAMPQNVVLLQPGSVVPDPCADRRAAAQQCCLGRQLDLDLALTTEVGSLMSFRPRSMRLRSFDKNSPFGETNTHTTIFPHLVPAGQLNRRRIVQALTAQDTDHLIDGAWMLPLGQEDVLHDLVIAFRRLPAHRFATVQGNHQPVIVRLLSRDRFTYVYLINDAPWPCRVVSQIVTPGAVALEELSGLRSVSQPSDGVWSVELTPYDLLAVRFDAPNVRVADIQVALPGPVKTRLRERIGQLVARAASLGQRRKLDALANPDFELPPAQDQPSPRGWTLIGNTDAKAELDVQQKHSGNAAVRLISQGNVSSLISDPIRAPRTGRLAFTAWVKMAPSFQGPLRLAVSGQHEGQEFYRPGIAQPSDEWKLFEFKADDLPLSQLEDLRIRFDLMGRGEVWIDDIEVVDLRFTDNERTELSRILTHAHFALEGSQLDDCRRLLEGHWAGFLTQHVPLPTGPVAVDRRPVRSATLPERKQGAPPADDPWWKRRLPHFLK
jgi:hypothetical protein